MTTIDEIREKYHCDKRQTGQVAFSPSLGTKYNLKGAGKVQKRELSLRKSQENRS